MKHRTLNASSLRWPAPQQHKSLLILVQTARCPVVSHPGFPALSSEVGGGAAANIKRICKCEERYVMEALNDNRTKWLHLRLQPQEYDQIHRYFRRTTCRKISEYARKILLQKPVAVNQRNQSLDEFMGEMMLLRKELNGIGNNFNQAVKKLHALNQIPEFRSWLITWELERKILFSKVEEIREKMDKVADVWLQ